jgi:hypothetical protein
MGVGKRTRLEVDGVEYDLVPTHIGWLVRKMGDAEEMGSVAVNGALMPARPDLPEQVALLKRLVQAMVGAGLLAEWSHGS